MTRGALPVTDAAEMPASGGAPPLAVAVATGIAAHLVAALVALRHLAPQLSPLLERSMNPAHALALERGLSRLLAAELLLPPVIPMLVAAGVWIAAGRARRRRDLRRWFALGWLPLAAESVAGSVAALLGPAAETPGELMERPLAFSTGLAPLLETSLVGHPALRYWLGVLTLAGAGAVYCWARALALTDDRYDRASRSDLAGDERATRLPSVELVVVATAYVGCAVLVRWLTPTAVRLFLVAVD